MENLQNRSSSLSNKENSFIAPKPVPKTPLGSKTFTFKNNNNQPKKFNILNDEFKTPNNNSKINNNIIKRVPLGNKDGNVSQHSNKLGFHKQQQPNPLSASASKKRIRRLRTPLGMKISSKPLNRKLNVLRDDPIDETPISNRKDFLDSDDDIEHIPEKQPELSHIPAYYEPFTEEDFQIFRNIGSNPRLVDRSGEESSDEFDIYDELPIILDDLEDENDILRDEKDGNTAKSFPHFMSPTVVSTAKMKNIQEKNLSAEVFDEGLTTSELSSLIEN
ncbi:hypothetical protein WICMUC_004014 [Wickerhamomyces mucosus]|uniref:Securin n=1 Tax=Wickerhamomyces mucosus TaxID=1378264 RepID=A0A9P8PK53_9ASCO|nr:hypothetical protein WICMUC_004014 [Wickerhamomyces mucosus]